MSKHTTGSLAAGKSQFLWQVDAFEAVLDAAAYADEYGLWVEADGSKATVLAINGPVGVVARSGELTDYINIYRSGLSSIDDRLTRFVHGSPANPP